MLKKIFFSLTIITFFFQITLSQSEEKFLSLKKKQVNVRYGPSFDFPVKFIYEKKNLPIKQIYKKENWRRIIDFKNNSGWIHWSQLKKVNSAITLEDKIMFKNSSIFSKPIAKVKKGRLLIIQNCNDEWCNVETANYKGWVNKKNLWGIVK